MHDHQETTAMPRDLAILGLVGFVTSFGAHAVAVNLPGYADSIGAGTLVIGILIAAYDLAEVFAKPVFGYLADKRGQVTALWAGLSIFSLASLAFLIVDPRLLVVIRLLQGLGAAAFSVVSVALVAAYFPKTRGQALGIYNALKGAGYVIAPVAGGLIVAHTGLDGLFVMTAVIGLGVLFLSLRLREPPVPAALEDDDDFNPREFLTSFTDARLLPWYGVIVINMFFVGILFGFVPVLLHDRGYTSFQAGLVISAGTLAYLLVQPPAGHLADRYGPQQTIIAGLLAASISLIALPFVHGPWLLALVMMGGLGIGVVWTNSDAMISRLARPGQLSTSLGTAGSYKEIGDMLGPLTIGALAQALGLAAGFVLSGIIGLTGTALLVRHRHDAATPSQPQLE